MIESRKAKIRHRVAWLAAPLLSVLVLWMLFLASGWFILRPAESVDWPGVAVHWLVLFSFFGFPVALVLTAIIAWPAGRYLHARGTFTLLPILVIANVVGVIVVAMMWSLIGGDFRPRNILGVLLAGIMTGSSGAGAFWVIGKPWSSAREPAEAVVAPLNESASYSDVQE